MSPSLIVSIIAVIISGIAVYISWRTQKRQLEIEEERRAEEKAASLVAQFYFDGKRRTLRITNNGNGEARNIEVLLDDQPIERHTSWVRNQPNRITTLAGQGFGDYILTLKRSGPIPKLAEVHWEDDVKKDNVSKSSLTL